MTVPELAVIESAQSARGISMSCVGVDDFAWELQCVQYMAEVIILVHEQVSNLDS